MLTARPAITLVPSPVCDAAAMCLTGLYSVDVKYSVIQTIAAVSTRPINAAPNTVPAVKPPACSGVSPLMNCDDATKNETAASIPETARPL